MSNPQFDEWEVFAMIRALDREILATYEAVLKGGNITSLQAFELQIRLQAIQDKLRTLLNP